MVKNRRLSREIKRAAGAARQFAMFAKLDDSLLDPYAPLHPAAVSVPEGYKQALSQVMGACACVHVSSLLGLRSASCTRVRMRASCGSPSPLCACRAASRGTSPRAGANC